MVSSFEKISICALSHRVMKYGFAKTRFNEKKKRLFVCDDSRVLKVYLLPRKRSSPLMCNDRRSETQQKKNKHSMKALVEIRERTTPTTVLQRTEIASLRLIFFSCPGVWRQGKNGGFSIQQMPKVVQVA